MTPAPLVDLAIDEIAGRVRAMTAALETLPTLTASDIAWVALPARSILGLSTLVESDELTSTAASITATTASLGADPSARSALVAHLAEMAHLAAQPPRASPTLEVNDLAEMARWLVDRLAKEHGVAVTIDVPDRPEGHVPRDIGGALLDALVHAIGSAITYGTPDGGALRLGITREPEALVILLSDRGNRGELNVTTRPDLGGERGVSLRAAHSRIVALGGDLTATAGAWGGTTVTIRVPIIATRRRP